MIKELSVDFEVKECCQALRVSRSGFYRWQQAEPSRREKENAQLVEQIKEVFAANKSRYGSPRVTRELRQQGLRCGEKRIARLMRQNKLVARAKKAFRPRTTVAGSSAAPNLIKGLEPTPSQSDLGQRYYLHCDPGGLALLGGHSGSVQPQSGGLETGRELGYIEIYYINQRLHSALGYQAPRRFEAEHFKKENNFF